MKKTGNVLLILLILLLPGTAIALDCMTENDCPQCRIDGAVLVRKSLYGAFNEKQTLTCEYGSGNGNAKTVVLTITCYENDNVARQWMDYYAGTGENPEKSQSAGLYGRPRWRCVGSGGTKGSGQTMSESFGCTGFTGTGRFVATITADGKAEYLSSDSAAEMARKVSAAQDVVNARIREYKDCFTGFSPGVPPSPQQGTQQGTPSADFLLAVSAGIRLNGNPVVQGTPVELRAGDRIVSSSTGYGFIRMQDGTEIRLDAGSEIVFNQEYLEVKIGGIWYHAEKTGRAFSIRTPSAVTSIPGTELVISADGSGATTVLVLSGSVTVSDRDGKGSVQVGSGQETVVAGGSLPVAPGPASRTDTGAWWDREEFAAASAVPSSKATPSPSELSVVLLGIAVGSMLAVFQRKYR